MATQITNTYETYDARGIREDLSDQIFRISPEETPFISSIGRESCNSTYYEWQNDALAAASGSNNQAEGADYSQGNLGFSAASPTVRLANYCQISTKTLIVDGTLEAVKKAGRKSELAYQLALRAAELKRDMETTAVQNQAASAGSGNGASNRTTAGFESFLLTNTSRGASGANPTLSGTSQGYPNAAPTDGTARTFTEAMLKSVAAQVWTAGGTLKTLMMGGTQKQVASAFSGIAVNRYQISTPEMGVVIGATDCYVTDFGKLMFVPNRFQRNRSALFIDPDRVALTFLRPFQTIELAKTGDAEKRLLLVEWGLKVYHEAGHGIVADLS